MGYNVAFPFGRTVWKVTLITQPVEAYQINYNVHVLSNTIHVNIIMPKIT